MANAWQNPSMIAAEALSVLEDQLVIANMFSRDKTGDFNYKPNGYAIGSSISIKTHPAYAAQEFTHSGGISVQDIRSSVRTMTIEKLYDVSVQITATEKVLNMDDFSEQVIRPAVVALAEKVETYVGTKIAQGAGLYASNDLFADAADVALARKAANYQQLDPMSRMCLVNDTLEAKLLGQTWFNQSQTRGMPGVTTLQSGNMGSVMGMSFTGTLYFPTSSLAAGTMVCATNNTSGTKNLIGDTSLIVDTQTASKVLKVGDRIQIAGVRRPLVVKTAIADTSATTEVELVDPITEIIPDNAAVTVVGSGNTIEYQGAIFDTPALAVAFPILDTPSDKPSFAVSNNGISIRITQGYDMTYKKETMSLDLLVGAVAWDPRRITLLSNY